MSHIESAMSWFNRIRRREQPAMRRIENLSADLNCASSAAIPLFFAKRARGG